MARAIEDHGIISQPSLTASVCRSLSEASKLTFGYSVRRTRLAKDGGYDLEVDIDDRRFLVEVKHWSAPNRVGPEAIRRFAEVVLREQAAGSLFLSSSGYTDTVATARLEVSRLPVMLGDSRKILSFCGSFVLSESGIWERDGSLSQIFFKGTL